MIEQEKRENTIKGLECCDAMHNRGEVKCANNCPYFLGYDGEINNNCRGALINDAIALLKAQEPRVMTLEEIDTAPAGYMVLQTRDMRDMLGWYDGLLFSVNVNWTVDIITLEGKKRLSKDDYGKTWRCWTSRPTDERREAISWN